MNVSLAPFVPSRPDIVKRMLELSHVNSNDIVYDLGCGDGRIIISAVNDFGAKKAVGYELKSSRCRQLIDEISNQNRQDKITIVNDDLMKADISEATVITLFLTTSGIDKLQPKLEREATKGLRIVSHDYEFIGWRASVRDNFDGHMIYLYTIPEALQRTRNNTHT